MLANFRVRRRAVVYFRVYGVAQMVAGGALSFVERKLRIQDFNFPVVDPKISTISKGLKRQSRSPEK